MIIFLSNQLKVYKITNCNCLTFCYGQVIVKFSTLHCGQFTVHLTLMMTSAQVVEPSVNVTTNSRSQDYTHPDDHIKPTYDITPGFKPFTVILSFFCLKL